MSQFTKKAIVETFLELLKEHSLDKITVKDIVEKCGINRNTFYYYYQDIYDLIDDVFDIETKKVLEDEKQYESWYEELLRVALFVVENRPAILHIYDSKSRDVLEKYLFAICDKLIRKYVEQQVQGMEVSDKEKEFVITFYGYSLVGMTLNWIKGNSQSDSADYLKGMADTDTKQIADKLVDKMTKLRIFDDAQGKTNLAAADVQGEFLIVSQFTLYADCRKGNRPSFTDAGNPQLANELYEYIIDSVRAKGFHTEHGSFGADMKVSLLNDGPFTIMLDSNEIVK